MTEIYKGTESTQNFYNQRGWTESSNLTEDLALFGVKEDGPIRKELYRRYTERIHAIFRPLAKTDFLELGCGGSPAMGLYQYWKHYTGVDFSVRGLAVAARKLEHTNIPHDLIEADITKLPLESDRYDTLYSAHVLYHIDTPKGQVAAINEAMRVLRPGGVAVFILANPSPVLFPVRFAKRFLANILKLKGHGPIPYLPLSINWYRKTFSKYGKVAVYRHSMPSTWFNQTITEYRMPGKLFWRFILWIECKVSPRFACLGNYIMFQIKKNRALEK